MTSSLVLCAWALAGALIEARAGHVERSQRVDAFGDPLPAEAIFRLGTVRLRHPTYVIALAFSSDGKTLGSADFEGRVRLWDSQTGRLRLELPAKTATDLVFVPDGKRFATAGDAGVRIWSATTGRPIQTLIETGRPPLALAPNGKSLLCSLEEGTVLLIDVKTGNVLRRFEGLEAPVSAIAFSPDSKAVAASGSASTPGAPTSRGATFVWEVATGRNRCRIDDESGYRVNGVAFSPGSRKLATSSKHLCLCDAATGKQLKQLDERAGCAVLFGPGDKQMVSAFNVCIWDTTRWECIRQLERGAANARIVAIAPDRKTIASNSAFDGRIRLWDLKSGREKLTQHGHLNTVGSVAVSPDGRFLATGSAGDGTLRLWNPKSGAEIHTLTFAEPPGGPTYMRRVAPPIAFSPSSSVVTMVNYPAVMLWDTATGKQVYEMSGGGPPKSNRFVNTASVWPKGVLQTELSRSEAGPVVKVWEPASGKARARISPYVMRGPNHANVSCSVLSPRGKTLATGSQIPNWDNMLMPSHQFLVQLWDPVTGRERLSLRPAAAPVSLTFSPDGLLLATSATRNDPIQLWSVATGREVLRLTAPGKRRNWVGFGRPVAFSPDGQLLATGGRENTALLWEVATGQLVRTLHGHTQGVVSLAFTPDGRTLLSGSMDTTALVWPLVPLHAVAVPSQPWSKRTGDRHWDALARDAARGYPALWALIADPEKAIPLLKERLQPDPELDAKKLARLVNELGAEKYLSRRNATRHLQQLGSRAESALRKAQLMQTDPEHLHRISQLLAPLDCKAPGPDLLRDLRAIQALEQMRRPQAESVLVGVAGGAESGPRTKAARAALVRLKKHAVKAEGAR